MKEKLKAFKVQWEGKFYATSIVFAESEEDIKKNYNSGKFQELENDYEILDHYGEEIVKIDTV